MGSKINVLLIDDCIDDLEFYEELLKSCSDVGQVFVASDGSRGLEIFRENEIDCIIIDFNLPQMNGVEILDHIRTLRAGYVATILLTGQPHQKLQAEAARKGAFNYIVKSVSATSAQLELAIQKAVSSANELNANRVVQ